MITIQFPDAVKPHMLRRLILLGIVLALAGLALSLYKGDILRDFFSDSQGLFLLKTLLLVIGSVFIVIGFAGLLLRACWQVQSIVILAKKSGRNVRIESRDMDKDPDEDRQIPLPSTLRPGDTIEIELKLKVLKNVRIRAAQCRILINKKRTSGGRHSKRIYENEMEDQSVRGRAISRNRVLTCSFEQRLPVNYEASSQLCFWILEMEVKAKGAPDYLQQKLLAVSA